MKKKLIIVLILVLVILLVMVGFFLYERAHVSFHSGDEGTWLEAAIEESLSEHSKAEGISMNQYCLYLLTQNDSA